MNGFKKKSQDFVKEDNTLGWWRIHELKLKRKMNVNWKTKQNVAVVCKLVTVSKKIFKC